MAFSTRSLNFDGVDDFVDIGAVAALQLDRTDPFSISFWFNPAVDQDQIVIGNIDSGGGNRGWEIRLRSTGQVQLNLNNQGGGVNAVNIHTTPAFAAGTWRHCVVTHDGSGTAAGITIYVDLFSQALTTLFDTLTLTTVSTADARIGIRDDNSLPYEGYLDDIAVYDIELSPAQVITIGGPPGPADLTSIGPTGNLVAFWQMGDGDTFPTITDHSVSGNDGTMTNMDAGDIEVEAPEVPENSQAFNPAGLIGTQTPDDVGVFASAFQLATAAVDFTAVYGMRARNAANTAYVSWESGIRDFGGVDAPEAISPGTAVVTGVWGDQLVLQTSVPTASYIQSVDAPATTNDPGTGTGYVLVDTASVNWSPNDTISLLGAPQVGTTIVVKDSTGSAASKAIVVLGNGNTIDGEADETLAVAFASRTFVFDGSEWKIV